MENEMDLDLVVFEDDDGNELTMEVLDYLSYEGKEYALLAEYDPTLTEDSEDVREAFVMEIRQAEDDEEFEEFVPVEEALAEKLIEIFQSTDFELVEFDDEDLDAE